MTIEIKDSTPEFKTLAEVQQHFKAEEITEMINRYVEWRRQQRKYMRAKLEKDKATKQLLDQLAKDPDFKAKLEELSKEK